MNNAMIVGRLVNEPEIKEIDGKKYTKITLAVNRAYKNCDGIYETDFIPVVLWAVVAEHTVEYCHKGDLMGIKGRLEMTGEYNEDNGYGNRSLALVADKVTYLSRASQD